MLNVLRDTLENMRRGNVVIDTNTRVLINQRIVEIIQAENWSSEDIDDAYSILLISNILYNNVGNVILDKDCIKKSLPNMELLCDFVFIKSLNK